MFWTLYRASKGSLERTKKAIDKFFEARLKYPEMMKDLSALDPSIQEYNDGSFVVPLPHKTKDGSTIIVSRLGRNPKKDYYNPYNRMKAFALTLLYLINDNLIEHGKVVAIQDLKNLTFAHMSGITRKFLYDALSFVVAFPYRIEAVHIASMPSTAEWGAALLKSALKKKLGDRIHIHRKPEELLKYYSKEILLSDFRGDLESTEILFQTIRKIFEERNDEFIDFEMVTRKCEALRLKNTDDVIVGSFCSLQVD